jgi:hypothetical protein
MRHLASDDRIAGVRPVDRRMVPGAGLVIAGVASALLWALVAGIVALA